MVPVGLIVAEGVAETDGLDVWVGVKMVGVTEAVGDRLGELVRVTVL